MKHEHAWERLPDLLGSHEDALLLAHVAGCHACQRQLFLLGRVDRLLRQTRFATTRPARSGLPARRVVALLAGLGAAVAVALVAFLPHPAGGRTFVLRTADGHVVGRATLVRADRSNVQVAFVARGMTRAGGDQFVLWAKSGDNPGATPVGRFMANRSGECRARFSLPRSERWTGFWVTSSSDPSVLVATT